MNTSILDDPQVKFRARTGWIVLFVTFSVVGPLLATYMYLATFESPFLVYMNSPLEATAGYDENHQLLPPPAVHPGEVIPLHVIRCNRDKSKHSYKISRRFENLDDPSKSGDAPDIQISIEGGVCTDDISQAHAVPPKQFPGRYKLKGTSTIPGLTKNFSIPWESTEFRIETKSEVKNDRSVRADNSGDSNPVFDASVHAGPPDLRAAHGPTAAGLRYSSGSEGRSGQALGNEGFRFCGSRGQLLGDSYADFERDFDSRLLSVFPGLLGKYSGSYGIGTTVGWKSSHGQRRPIKSTGITRTASEPGADSGPPSEAQ